MTIGRGSVIPPSGGPLAADRVDLLKWDREHDLVHAEVGVGRPADRALAGNGYIETGNVYDLADGKIKRIRVYSDQAEALAAGLR